MTTKVARHASKKASPSINIISKLCSFNNFAEADFDQPTNYSLLYAEENSVIEEVGHFEYLGGSSEQENTITTYYTEGTPFETPLHFSTSTSTSDLLKLDETRVNNIIQIETKEFIALNQPGKVIEESPVKPEELSQLKIYMEFENKEKECENTDVEIYLPEDSDDCDEKCDEERLEKIINVTPSQSPIELCDKDREGKIVTFGGEDHYSQQTPLMFSRCSSLGSLSAYEQSFPDDRSSVISDFSRRTSEVVSPSELPDSPAQLISGIAHQKEKKLSRKKVLQQRDKSQPSESCHLQQETLKHSIFEDDLAVFKEESTPVKFQSVAASSLSSLTIDDDDDIDERDRGEVKNKAGVIKTSKAASTYNQFNSEDEKRKVTSSVENFEDNSYISMDDQQILDEYIRKGIAKVTRQHINDVSTFNLQASNTYDSTESEPGKSCEAACKPSNSLDFFDENCDLTAEEEKLLDECIRRGIAKVTRQNINDVTSLSLRSDFPGFSTFNCDKGDNQEKQLQH